jgi:hypothetical protein
MQAAAETASGQDSIQARTTIHEALHRALREDSKARDQFVAAQKSKKTWTEEIAKRDKKSLKIRTTKTDRSPNELSKPIAMPRSAHQTVMIAAGSNVSDSVGPVIDLVNSVRRLGVIFHERTRIRPANQVFGEAIYQLALTPGEEVQITQTAETKQRTAFQEISDQDVEQQTSFSSTWSTDMASTIASQQSFQQSTNVGGGFSGSVPDVPVSLSTTASATSSRANSDSAQETVNMRRERTETASARMRQQHRIQIDVSTETTRTSASVRTLRNLNQQRSVMHTFFKLYRKEQCTLERYNAQLCLRLVVDDPARLTRESFHANLTKIDPAAQAFRNIVQPAGKVSASFDFTVTAPTDDGGLLHGTRVDRYASKPLDLRALTGTDAQYVLSGPAKFTMTRCEVTFYGDADLHPTSDSTVDPDIVPDSQLTEVIPNVFVGWSFVRNGGTVSWTTEPKLEDQNTSCLLKLDLPLFYTAPSILGEKESEVGSVAFHVETAGNVR